MAVLTTTLALNQNEVTAALFNQIISQEVFSKNIAGLKTSLVERLRVDGTLYGDKKLFVSTDTLQVNDWVTTGSSSLLTVTNPPAPKLEVVEIDVFKQIAVTIYPYMQKRAFADEGTYAQFIAVVLSWLGDTKKVYETTLVNAYVGTVTTSATINEIDVEYPAAAAADNVDAEAVNRLTSMAIGKAIADLSIELSDVSRAYNENGFLRSYEMSDFIFVWNATWYNKIRHVDLPTVFHKDGVIDLKGMDELVLPARYFGTISADVTTGTTNRALKPMIVDTVYYNAGDLIPQGKTVATNSTYDADATIVGKLVHKQAIPFMSAFSVGTSFFDAQKLRENHWLTFGHSSLDYIRNFPIITITATEDSGS